jgi:hypothetical protein
MKRILLLCVPLLLLLPGPAGAQGLGDAAKRERQKRQAVPAKTGEPRVFDNDDLDAGKPPKKPGEEDAAAAAPAQATADPGPDLEESRAAQDRERLAAAEQGVADAEARLAAVQARVQELKDKLNPMSPSYVFGAASTGMAAPGADMRIREELQQAEAEAADAQRGVEDARRLLDAVRSPQQSGAR